MQIEQRLYYNNYFFSFAFYIQASGLETRGRTWGGWDPQSDKAFHNFLPCIHWQQNVQKKFIMQNGTVARIIGMLFSILDGKTMNERRYYSSSQFEIWTNELNDKMIKITKWLWKMTPNPLKLLCALK